MHSFRYFLRLLQAFFKKFKVIIFFSIFVGAVFFLLLNLVLPNLMNRKTEKIGILGKYTADELPDEILGLVSGGLTKLDSSGLPEPDIATSWDTSDKGVTWTFHLDTNKKWQNGDPITADTINYEFSDAEIKVIDDQTIEYKLQTPFAAFPVVVSKPVFKKGFLGTGEWKVKKASLIGGFVNKLTLQDENGNKKIYVFYPTETSLKLGYKLGEINAISDISDPEPFSSWKTAKTEERASNSHFVALFLNNQDQFLAEKTVRQGLNYAVNKEGFRGTKAISPISPDSWGYNPLVKPYDQDIEKAKDLLDLKEGEVTLSLSTSSTLLPVAEKIKEDWEKIGIKTEINVVTGVPQEFQVFLATVDIPKDPDQYSLWHSTQETNISKYQNPRIDKLLEDGRTELDLEERKKIYLDFQRFLVEDSPAIFLYHPTFYTVTRK